MSRRLTLRLVALALVGVGCRGPSNVPIVEAPATGEPRMPVAEELPPDPSPETEPPPPVDIESCSIMKGFDEGCRGCMLVGCCNPPVAFESTVRGSLSAM